MVPMVVAAAVAVVLTLSSSVSAAGNPPLKNTVGVKVPAKYVKSGLKAGMFCATGMLSYCDANNSKAYGILADFAKAWGAKFGVKVVVKGTTWEALMPGALSGRTDAIVGIGDLPERRNDFTFVDMFWGYNSIVARYGNPKNIKSESDLCGTTMSASTGSGELTTLQGLSDECTKAGKPAITIHEFAEQTATYLDVSSGRADGTMTDVFAATTLVKENKGVYSKAFNMKATFLWGVAVPKKNTALLKAVKAGVARALKDGTFKAILAKKYGFRDDILIKQPMVNGKPVK